jgi:hypothetical protein
MRSTLDGIVIAVSLHSEKVSRPKPLTREPNSNSISRSAEQSLKASLSMSSKVAGMTIEERPLYKKSDSLSSLRHRVFERRRSNVTFRSDLQYEKHPWPIETTLAGISIDSRCEPLNASDWISRSFDLDSKVTSRRFLQSKKQASSMISTLRGMQMTDMEEKEKEYLPRCRSRDSGSKTISRSAVQQREGR